LHGDGLLPPKRGWSIADKKNYASQHRGRCTAWVTHYDLWERLCDTYGATVEARHSLVHRRFSLSTNGDMIDIRDLNGRPQADLTVAEQEAFTRMAQRVASATLAVALSNRERSAIAWLLDQLTAHHKKPLLGGSEAGPIPAVWTDATRTRDGWAVDADYANGEVRRVFGARPFYDIEIHFPETGLPPISAPLEDVPAGPTVAVDPRSPPIWARP
jgi:hypothetical protein